jgi:hypothetical protein
MAIAEAAQIVKEIGTGQIDRVEGAGGTMVVFIAMCILFGAATYFTGRLYGKVGYITCAAGFVLAVLTLAFLGGIGFG